MFVSFYFECPYHGRFVEYLDTKDYPDRNWPKGIFCPKLDGGYLCPSFAVRIPICENFSPDPFWAGKEVKAMDKVYTSRDYFRRDLKSQGLSALTTEERYSIKQKTQDELHLEYFDRPDVAKARRENISQSLDGFGVIDKLSER